MPASTVPQVARYRILDFVGEGAMGIVYRAEDTVLNRVVALKVMNEGVARQEELRDRFLREARAAGSLSHPNLVTVYDFGEADGHLYIAMEFVGGEDLETILMRRVPLKLQEKLDIVVDVLTGLDYAHKRGIVHRDVKPANIRITEDRRAKLMDFGVAHIASSTVTRTGEQMGTPSYMAPEQVTGGKATPASDLFSAGTVLYELLTGAKPFAAPTLHSVMYKIVSESPPAISDLVPGISPALERIVGKALEKDADRRYQSALEMARDLTEVRAGLSGPTTTGTLSLRAPLVTAASGGAAQRTRRAALVGGGLALAVVAAAVWAAGVGRAPAEVAGSAPPLSPPTAPPVAPTADAPTADRPAADAQEPATAAPPPAVAGRAAARVSTPATVAGRAATAATPAAEPPRADTSGATPPASPPPATVQAAAPVPPPPVSEPPLSRSATNSATTSATTSAATTAPAAPAAPDPARIPDAVEAYARAIESRQVSAVRQAYPGLTAAQQRNFEQFFEATRSLRVSFSIANVEASGASADVRLMGTYEFVTAEGKTQRQPVSFRASVHHDGTRWRLVSVR